MSAEDRPALQRSVSRAGFFALAFGSMIGVGWVTALGGWLGTAGPGGAILAFAGGGLLMILVGLCYAELTPMMPVAGGEVAYAYCSSGTGRAFVIGWFLAFGYLSVSAFEAISVGRVASYLIPGTDRWPLYDAAGQTVYGAHLALAFTATSAITWVNYRGMRGAARLQVWLTVALVLSMMAFVGAGLLFGNLQNARPWFVSDSGGAWGGVLAVLVTAPFWFVGFDTIPQAAEEADAGLHPGVLGKLIPLSISAALAFYAVLILSTSMAGPWGEIVSAELPAAEAFRQAFGSEWLARLVLVSALIGLLTSWNGFLIAGSRVLFALGRARIVPPVLGATHRRYGSPSGAILFSGVVTAVGACLGTGGLLSFINVGSLCIALAFVGVAQSTLTLRNVRPDWPRPYRPPGGPWLPRFALCGAVLIVSALLLPGSPAMLNWPVEWGLFAAVLGIGAAAWRLGSEARRETPEETRRKLVLGDLVVR